MSEKEITEASELKYGIPELEYIQIFGDEYFPVYDPIYSDSVVNPNNIYEHSLYGLVQRASCQITYTFVDRYNSKKIKADFSYSKYMENQNIQRQLKLLGLDSTKFWYFFLFVYDLSWGYYMDGFVMDDTVLEQLKNFIATLEKQTTEKPKEEITLIAQTDQKIATLKSTRAIQRIISYCKEGLQADKGWANDYLSYQSSNTQLAYGIAHELFLFFDLMESVKQQRRKGAKTSKPEKELIVEILKFGNCVEKITSTAKDYMNALMDKSKRKDIPLSNNYYC